MTWEPLPSSSSSKSSSSRLTNHGTSERSTELLATTGDALRVWEVETSADGFGDDELGSEDDEDGDRFGYRRDRGRVGKVGGEGQKVRLRERSKLTNVSPSYFHRLLRPSRTDKKILVDLTGQSPGQPSPSTDILLLVIPLPQPPRHLQYRYHLYPVGHPHIHGPHPTDRSRQGGARRLLSPSFFRRLCQRRVGREPSGFRSEGIGAQYDPV